jgi:ceramide glucosyltransferase
VSELLGTAATIAGVLADIGLVQGVFGWFAVRGFASASAPPFSEASLPSVTILKPLHGDEPLLEEALASFCAQDYPACQIVFGVQDPSDSALPVVNRLRQRFPALDMAVVIDPTLHGPNRKIGNLINMLPAAKHPVLVISDADIHAAPDYLRAVAAALQEPGTGLVTTLYTGRLAEPDIAAQLGASQIAHTFLPGVLLGRAMGRKDCLGATMALRRETLDRLGGLQALVQHLADDGVLGRLVTASGMHIAIAATVPQTTVPETHVLPLLRHELRWGRTNRSLAPVSFALSAVQFPIVWSAIAALASGGADWALGLFAIAWLGRAVTASAVDRALGLAPACSPWLFPLRDLLSFGVVLASYGGDKVTWRGKELRAVPPDLAPKQG